MSGFGTQIQNGQTAGGPVRNRISNQAAHQQTTPYILAQPPPQTQTPSQHRPAQAQNVGNNQNFAGNPAGYNQNYFHILYKSQTRIRQHFTKLVKMWFLL